MTWNLIVVAAAKDELADLPDDMQAKFLRIARMLATFGPREVGMPHVRHLEGPLWEIRMTGRSGIARAIYVTAERMQIVVLRMFVKKTEKAPAREIELAMRRFKEWKNG